MKSLAGLATALVAVCISLLLLEREMRKYQISVDKHFADVPPVLANCD